MSGSQPGDIFQPGDLLNNTYRIESILGRGGTSEVYKARSEISGRVIAVKALRAEYARNEDFLVLMTREEEIRDIRHDAVVRYYDTQRMPDGVVYLAMDFVDGTRLDKMASNGGLGADALMTIGQRVAEGLVAAHGHRIVHRDLSPDNIILRNDRPEEAVIIDFGIAKDTNPGAQTIVGNEFAGKYAYAAPEQLSGNTDARSDIYALGALLLASFRGRKPDLGASPMEMLTKKSEPLDLAGVPEPLSALIARMSDPDPDKRFASAEEVVAAFKDPTRVGADATDLLDLAEVETDATVVVAPPRAAGAEAAPARPARANPSRATAAKTASATKKKSGALVPILAVVAVLTIGAGGFFAGLFDGLIGPRYPVADPFTITIEKGPSGAARAVGNVPSPEIEDALAGQIAALGGTAELTLATGNIPEPWGSALLEMLDTAATLEEFRIDVSDTRAEVFGLAATQQDISSVTASLRQSAAPAFNLSLDLMLGPRFLPADFVRPILLSHSDCGPLSLLEPPPTGYGLDDPIVVRGRLASDGARDALSADLASLAGPRPVRLETEMLNEALCEIDAVLPASALPGGFELRFGYGDRDEMNRTATYSVGENPVIDVAMPPDAEDGFLRVSVVDVKGVVFHLLPNLFRPDNSVAALRAEFPDGIVRLSYGLAEAEGRNRLAFTVDETPLGKNQILVLHTDAPLFDELRPTTESSASFVDAFVEARNAGNISIRSIDGAILTTEP
ncbi:MAG: serine/threonine-protein kinase [Pseudomonadota bacterium]